MKELLEFIEKNLVSCSWGDYDGLKTPSLADLGALKVLVEAAIAEKMKS